LATLNIQYAKYTHIIYTQYTKVQSVYIISKYMHNFPPNLSYDITLPEIRLKPTIYDVFPPRSVKQLYWVLDEPSM